MTLYVGMVLRDNDPRYEGRTVVVTDVDGVWGEPGYGARYQGPKRKSFIAADRIYEDGKVRHQGWSVVKAVPAEYTDALARGLELGLKDHTLIESISLPHRLDE